MELMRGGSLHSRLQDMNFVRTFDNDKISKVIYQVLLALNFCHNIQVVHRDIKAENILFEEFSDRDLDSDYHVKLCDFGLSVKQEPQEFNRDPCGTIHFFAPEIVKK